MCGIAGWVDYGRDIRQNVPVLEKMSETLARRGPDASGMHKERHACLLHRRLIVVDPKKGKQPMTIEYNHSNYTLAYNGELYNVPQLRRELESFGYSFKGYSDTEVLLVAFLHWRENCLEKLNGIFAFAVWDTQRQELFFARDRMGVKPLFFHPYEGGLIFASEIKTLLANPLLKPQIDDQGLMELFFLGPGRTPGQGIFKGVYELKPGEFGRFSKDGGLQVKRYWGLRATEFQDNENVALEKTRYLVTDAIERQLVSDVPLCCFLSGGIDSSIIANTTSNVYKRAGKGPLTTYSIDYLGEENGTPRGKFEPETDSDFIKIMVNSIGSVHKNLCIRPEDLALSLKEATLARDLPGMADIDSSLLLACREMKKDFTVALSGECADEIFGGYPWFHDKDQLFREGFPWSRSLALRKSIFRGERFKSADEYVLQRYLDTVNRVEKLPGEGRINGRMRELFALNFEWFMQTLLDRKDRMSMNSGLEVRVPFCDHLLVEYAYNMPWEIKSMRGREKGILREAMRGILPEKILFRKKNPYPKTHSKKYFEAICAQVRAILDDTSSPLPQLVDKQAVLGLIEAPETMTSPWYGQLMYVAQTLGYIVQTEHWLREYNVEIV